MSTYTLSIINEQGEPIFERPLDADAVIGMLVGANAYAASKPAPSTPAPNKPNGGRGRPRSDRKCGNCGQKGHTYRTCSADRVSKKTAPDTKRLTEDQFEDLKIAEEQPDFSSLEYARDNDLPLAEVNRAVRVLNYKKYLSS